MREENGFSTADPWWRWVGVYNTGSLTGSANRRYTRNILGRYLEFCSLTVSTAEGERALREFWPGCAAVAEAFPQYR
jgi:hypothetical protein